MKYIKKPMRFICHWLKMCVIKLCQRMNYHICLIIYWILFVMRKYWDCIKECVEGICIDILIALRFILKHIGKCGKMEIVIQQNCRRRKEDKVFQNIMM